MPLYPAFKKHLKNVQEKLKQCEFTVLIWGPGEKTDTPERRKRLKLREDLQEIVGSDGVVFSEEDEAELTKLRQAGGFAAEYIQARAADAVILIPESPGPLTEAAAYSDELRGKTIVFAKRRLEEEKGFAAEAYSVLKVEEIEPDEWEDCRRVRRKAREFVETLRLFKFRKTAKKLEWE